MNPMMAKGATKGKESPKKCKIKYNAKNPTVISHPLGFPPVNHHFFLQ
jgi:hypothetical protein